MCPRFVYISIGDNRLLQDLDDARQVGAIRRTLFKEREVILQEALPNVHDAWLPSPSGSHVVELVVPLRLRKIPTLIDPIQDGIPASKSRATLLKAMARVKPPGSNWISLKLYGPQSGEESLITGPIKQLCSGLPATFSWYFLRYADPQPHLRLRICSNTDQCDGETVAAVSRWATGLLNQERCESFSFDTYVREIERYGGPLVLPFVEAAFCTDSVFATEFLTRRAAIDPLVAGVFVLDGLLEQLGLTVDQSVLGSRGR